MDIIRNWREMHDVSQRKMAKGIGVHPTTLSQIEHQLTLPSVPVLCRIWDFTGLSAEALMRSAESSAKKTVAAMRKKQPKK